MPPLRRASGCLFGAAIGDAFAARTEFLDVPEILRRWPPAGPTTLEGSPALVTDDTQMMLAVGEALVAARDEYTAEVVEPKLREAFVAWLVSPDNTRAPGGTCLRGCSGLKTGLPWVATSQLGSKGCGANMRVQPVGLLHVDDETRSGLAQLQAAMTHGHPTALSASDLTAKAIALLSSGEAPSKIPRRLREYAVSQRARYAEAWLGNLWERALAESPVAFIERGWDQCLAVLDNLDAALGAPASVADPCDATGQGWIAEEALGTALLCFLLSPDDPVRVVQRAAVTKGDSDSIACIAGAFVGTYLGLSQWPTDWLDRIEYRDRLEPLGQRWDVS